MELNSHSWIRTAGGVADSPSLVRRPPSRLSRALLLGALAAAATAGLGTTGLGTAGLGTTSLGTAGPPAVALSAPGQLTQVVVRASAGQLTQVEASARRLGATVGRELRLIDAVSAAVPVNRLAALRATPGVAEVSADAVVALEGASYDPSGDQHSLLALQEIVGNRALWPQWTGAGVDVALIDSGVAPVAGLSDPGKVVNGPDLTPESQSPATAHLDTYGHGTHLAGIIAGHDSGVTPATNAANPTPFLGVAPDARIVNVKAADVHGVSDVSQVIAGIDWVVQHAHDNGMNIRVLNLSFGTDSTQPYALDPLAYAAEQAWKHGIVTVVSAGNTGASSGRLTDPAIDPFVLAVGADNTNGTLTLADDTIAAFSSRGDGTRSPDLVAPGAHVQSLRVPGSYIDAKYGATGQLGDRYFRGSGTSQAAAFVSGSVAQLVQQHPGYTPDQIKALLVGTASRLPSADRLAQGAGLINMRAAEGAFDVTRKIQSFVASLGAGTLEAARGSQHMVQTDPTTGQGSTLTGETDVLGDHVSTSTLAETEQNGNGWSGGVSARIRGEGDESTRGSPASSSWASSSWASSRYASGTWTSDGWADANWTSSSWASSSWASSSWASSSWASSSWASSSWASSSWSSSSWADASWQSSTWG